MRIHLSVLFLTTFLTLAVGQSHVAVSTAGDAFERSDQTVGHDLPADADNPDKALFQPFRLARFSILTKISNDLVAQQQRTASLSFGIRGPPSV